mmetsp:Transcript_67411/g.186827  ORF Transcript_67411/g.186827 Transcript_67411/m.186827 type:complete len:225 (+) Transcript_67411:1118-1792(+)
MVGRFGCRGCGRSCRSPRRRTWRRATNNEASPCGTASDPGLRLTQDLYVVFWCCHIPDHHTVLPVPLRLSIPMKAALLLAQRAATRRGVGPCPQCTRPRAAMLAARVQEALELLESRLPRQPWIPSGLSANAEVFCPHNVLVAGLILGGSVAEAAGGWLQHIACCPAQPMEAPLQEHVLPRALPACIRRAATRQVGGWRRECGEKSRQQRPGCHVMCALQGQGQ